MYELVELGFVHESISNNLCEVPAAGGGLQHGVEVRGEQDPEEQFGRRSDAATFDIVPEVRKLYRLDDYLLLNAHTVSVQEPTLGPGWLSADNERWHVAACLPARLGRRARGDAHWARARHPPYRGGEQDQLVSREVHGRPSSSGWAGQGG